MTTKMSQVPLGIVLCSDYQLKKKISQVGLFHILALTKEHREPVLEHAASQQCRWGHRDGCNSLEASPVQKLSHRGSEDTHNFVEIPEKVWTSALFRYSLEDAAVGQNSALHSRLAMWPWWLSHKWYSSLNGNYVWFQICCFHQSLGVLNSVERPSQHQLSIEKINSSKNDLLLYKR